MRRSFDYGVGSLAWVAMAVLAGGGLHPARAAVDLQNGELEEPYSSGVAHSWSSYLVGATTAAFAKNTNATYVHGGLVSQQIQITSQVKGHECGILQTIDANVGDAISFEAWTNSMSGAAYNVMKLGVQWDGSTAVPTTWLSTVAANKVWVKMSGAGNATASNVTLFLDFYEAGKAGVNQVNRFDDAVSYHAYVPAVPGVGNPTHNTLDVDVDPGSNLANALAQYAVTLGGGGYTLGTDWLQADGSIAPTALWQTDATWATETVTGLAPGIAYTLAVKARYSDTIVQETSLGAGTMATTLPEPATLLLLTLGGLSLLRRRR